MRPASLPGLTAGPRGVPNVLPRRSCRQRPACVRQRQVGDAARVHGKPFAKRVATSRARDSRARMALGVSLNSCCVAVLADGGSPNVLLGDPDCWTPCSTPLRGPTCGDSARAPQHTPKHAVTPQPRILTPHALPGCGAQACTGKAHDVSGELSVTTRRAGGSRPTCTRGTGPSPRAPRPPPLAPPHPPGPWPRRPRATSFIFFFVSFVLFHFPSKGSGFAPDRSTNCAFRTHPRGESCGLSLCVFVRPL